METFKIEDISVGDGITACYWSDRWAMTVIRKTAKTIIAQRDKATLITKMESVPGGFSRIVINNESQRYTYEPDPNGNTYTFRLTKKGWRESKRGGKAVLGRYEFYDYNF